VILTDTGPLVALVDADDSAHASCVAALTRLTKPLLTTWPCFTEACILSNLRVDIRLGTNYGVVWRTVSSISMTAVLQSVYVCVF